MNIPGTVPLPDGMKLEDIEWADDLKALAAIDQANRKRLKNLDRLADHWHRKRAAALEVDAQEMAAAIDAYLAEVRRALDVIAERRKARSGPCDE